jgi:Phosphoesterase family
MPLPGPIEHVVVLMFENRSFDHMLGLLDHGGLVPVTEEPIPNPINPSDPASEVAVAFALDKEGGLDADPKHGYPDVMRQLSANTGPWQAPYELTNSGFAWNYQERRHAPGKQALGCHTAALLPVLSTLAREYAICSRWHCSLPSETWPNRLFAHAATSDDLVENEIRFYDNRTIFEALSSAGHSWHIYAGDIPQVAAYPELHFHDGEFRFSRLGSFFDHARDGRLPKPGRLPPRLDRVGVDYLNRADSGVFAGSNVPASRAATSNAEAKSLPLRTGCENQWEACPARAKIEAARPPARAAGQPRAASDCEPACDETIAPGDPDSVTPRRRDADCQRGASVASENRHLKPVRPETSAVG